MSQNLTEKDYQRAANQLGVPIAAVKAVASVESNGGGFLSDGRVKVQYEPHVMYQRVKLKFGQARADKELKAHPDLLALKPGSYQKLDQEDKDMDRAATLIDRQCALESASWGAFQIMGYHWKTCGYPTQQAFINAQYSDAGQLDTFVRFVNADVRLVRALQRRDWAGFASVYNGPGYKANKYDTKMASAYAQFGGA
ncbi:N-acetylmuramidase family protein [Klebsiella pneumoniae]|uniref:N-acetylmuramidase family protein n=1 Tax=Klebsiella pneumoniae TaxID=573 RepID=UPI000D6428C0|nr:N-acetylmuramidase family protein [Klebsiella pneumoniae]